MRRAVFIFAAAVQFAEAPAASRSVAQDGGAASAISNRNAVPRRERISAACELQSGGESAVVAVLPPQTLRLSDGRFVRLAEILVPATAGYGIRFDASSASADYLRKEALGKRVEIKFGGMQRDRYGVFVAHVYVKGQQDIWLQQGLVNAGLATVYPQSDNHSCSEKLFPAEIEARENKRGNWGLALFKVLNAAEPKSILNLVQTYQIVEGKVDSASSSGSRFTLSFGKTPKRDFAAIVESGARTKLLPDKDAQTLPGATMRLRGWIDRKSGPFMSIALPEQVEIVTQPNAEAKIPPEQR